MTSQTCDAFDIPVFSFEDLDLNAGDRNLTCPHGNRYPIVDNVPMLSRPEAEQTIGPAAKSLTEATGRRSLQQLLRRQLGVRRDLDVRYWLPTDLQKEFNTAFGATELEVDCYFGLGLQPSDMALYSIPARQVVRLSEALRKSSRSVRPLAYLTDSVYLTARNSNAARQS
jgi:hypothetical protein